jgi:nucleotide-binding universal stress UspA family protein
MTVLTDEQSTGAALFARVLAGVDGSDAGLQAAFQAGRLVAPEGTLELATAIYLIDANLQHWAQEQVEATLELDGGPALRAAALRAGPRAKTQLLNGPSKQALLEEAARYGATLIAVGSHEHSRLSEMLIGGVAGPLLHEAPCSVLIARPAISEALFPASLTVGVDGSPSSLEALAVAEHLSARFGSDLRAVLARHRDVDVVHAELRAPQLEIVDGSAVDVLVDASATADLVIVGSHGLHGLSAVGSVSERLAHKAHSSVLVVRREPHPRDARTNR